MARDIWKEMASNQSGDDGTQVRSSKVLEESSSITSQSQSEINLGLGEGSVRRKTPEKSIDAEKSQATPENIDPNTADTDKENGDKHTIEDALKFMQDILNLLAQIQQNAQQPVNNAITQNVHNQTTGSSDIVALDPCPNAVDYPRQEVNTYETKMEPSEYDGTSSWNEYLLQFNLVAEINRWNNHNKALYLATSLRGTARTVLADMPPSLHRNFTALVNRLTQRFGPNKDQSEMFWMMLNNRHREPGETLPELAHNIRQLVKLANPDASHSMWETLAIRHFSNAMTNIEMRLRISDTKPKTMDEAVRIVVQREAFYEAEKLRRGPKKPVRTVETEPTTACTTDDATSLNVLGTIFQETMKEVIAQLHTMKRTGNHHGKPRGNFIKCYRCGAIGHIRRYCRAPTSRK